MFLEKVPIFRQPQTIELSAYEAELKAHAIHSRAYIHQLIEQIRLVDFIREQVGWFTDNPDNIDVEILATGSDGRDEKATFVPGRLNGKDSFIPQYLHEASIPSSMNVIALMGLKSESQEAGADDHAVNDILASAKSEIMQLMERELMQLGVFEHVEAKSVYSPTPSGFLDSPNDCWPSRIFDSVSLSQDTHLPFTLRKRYFDELKTNGRAKKLRERESNRAKQYRKVCSGGERAGHTLLPGMQYVSATTPIVTHFNLDSGIAYYDRENNIASFKYGPLRTVQMHVSLLLMSLLSSYEKNAESGVKIAHELPRSTAEKLRYLHGNELIDCSDTNVRSLIDNYHFFLRHYHQSEWESAAHKGLEYCFASNENSRQEVRERLSDTVEYAQQLSMKK